MVNYKVLFAAMVAASGLGMSALTLADSNSDAAQAVANASNSEGMYLGGQFGLGNISGDKGFKQANTALGNMLKDAGEDYSQTNRNGSLAGRVYAGYQFNSYLAVEAGYGMMGNDKYTTSIPDAQITTKAAISTNAADLALKGILPLSVLSDSLSNASLFAKVGAADSMSKITGLTEKPIKRNKILPEFGVGAGYTFDSGVGVDVSYNRIQGSGKIAYSDANGLTMSKGFAPSSNTVMGGLSYHFSF